MSRKTSTKVSNALNDSDQNNEIANSKNPQSDMCQCCLATNNLRNISKPFLFNGTTELYSQMMSACFSEWKFGDGQICAECVRRLRQAYSFRQCVQSAQSYLSNYKREPTKDVKINKNTDHIDNMMDSEDFSPNNEGITEFNQNDNVAADSGYVKIENLKDEPNTSDDDDFADFFYKTTEAPKQIFSREVFDVGEQRTLPYVLDNTDRKCEICHKEFSFLGELAKHMPEHYPNHICDICGKICATRKSLNFHVKTHTDIRLNCKMCDKTFKNKSNLNAHVKVQHRGEKILFKCSQCGEVLNTYNARIKHMAEKHGREDKSYKCTQCSCKYRLGSQLRAHVRRVHLQEKNHKCQVCGSSFFTRKCLENHSLKHSGEKNFSCSLCNKSYGRKESLRQHMKSHEEESYILPDYTAQCQEYINM
ncbi:uncharacterized protein LOC143915525 isoform X2 [Arctopsyche grandis]|uniref:uncharacterized protein LOC143915525 isoform X2 n=1 Tax=Arctopsyche grandis TaxID=121162 RepID=UPI00406D9A38